MTLCAATTLLQYRHWLPCYCGGGGGGEGKAGGEGGAKQIG